MHEESALLPYNSANIHARKKIKPVLESPECLLLGNISETCEFQIWKNGACLDQKSLCKGPKKALRKWPKMPFRNIGPLGPQL